MMDVLKEHPFVLQVQVLWVVVPCSDVVEYQRFGGVCCLHLHEDLDLNLHRREDLKSRILLCFHFIHLV
jgi:hypothetical protein